MRLSFIALLGACLLSPAMAQNMGGGLNFLAAHAIDPTHLLPPPPANDSFQTNAELASLQQINDTSSPQQKAAALADSKNETVFLFAPVMGTDFTAAKFPATAALFKQVSDDADFFEHAAKKIWRRPRPYLMDKNLIPACGAPKKPSFSYPSGHAIQAWSQGMVLAALLPSKAAAIESRAAAFAFEREICGAHYPSDLEAGHAMALVLAEQILASPKFQREAAAARRELALVK